MKKNLLLFVFLLTGILLHAQDIDKSAAMKSVVMHSEEIGLTGTDLANLTVTDAYKDQFAGTEMIYLQQTFKGIPVFNQLMVLAFKNGKLVSKSGGCLPGIEKLA